MKSYSTWLVRSIPLLLLGLVSANEGAIRPRHLQQAEIFGGEFALGEEYPFFALLYRSRDDESFICGGTLISPDTILTAAHCFDNGRIVRFASIGPTFTFIAEEFLEVDSITLHPRYSKDNDLRDYDFAIIKLKTSSTAPPAAILLDTDFPSEFGTPLETIGVGADGFDDSSLILKRVDLSYVPFEFCRVTNVDLAGISDNLHECAEGSPDPSTGPCAGDFGGPLLLRGTNILIGVLSLTADCGVPSVDVYAKVSSNFHWISAAAGFPPTNPPTAAPSMSPSKDSDSSSSDSKDDHYPTHAPSPTTHPCDWFFNLGDMLFDWFGR